MPETKLKPFSILETKAPSKPTLGVQTKPKTCYSLCPYASVGSSFVADWCGPAAEVAFMIPYPTGDDCINQRPMSGRAGESFERTYLAPLGKTRDNCLFSCATRCRPKGNGSKAAKHGTPITGKYRDSIFQACRQYDLPTLASWGPDCYIITFALSSVYSKPAFTRLLQRDIAKAFEFAARGFRPLVLMGGESSEIFAPYIKGNGGPKGWRGHWAEMKEYPFATSGKAPTLPNRFMPAR